MVATLQAHVSLQRWLAFIAAGISAILIIFHVMEGIWFFLAGAAAFFLGITDFGQRCPLFLSVRYLYARMRKRTDPDKIQRS